MYLALLVKHLLSASKPYYCLKGTQKIPAFVQPQNINKSHQLFRSCQLEKICDSETIKQYVQSIEWAPNRRQFILFGRSNVGKSSLINQLLGVKAAQVSKKPGKTQQLFFYRLHGPHPTYIVDSPGYGFTTNASKRQMNSWRELINVYLSSPYCHRILCLFDCQHGLKSNDQMLLDMLEAKLKPYVLVGTKSDKKTIDIEQWRSLGERKFINDYLHVTSSNKREGINQLRWHLSYLRELPLSIMPG